MNLKIMPADRFACYFFCIGCGKRMLLSKAEPPIYADLDGEPFKAYYCGDCARERMQAASLAHDRGPLV